MELILLTLVIVTVKMDNLILELLSNEHNNELHNNKVKPEMSGDNENGN